MKRPYQIDPRPSQGFIWLPSSSTSNKDHILDQLKVMHRLESTRYTRSDYLYHEKSPYKTCPDTDPEQPVSFSSSYCHPVINELTRQNMIDLLYEIGDYCHFRRETVQYAVWNLMDRYLALPTHKPLTSKLDFQLVASTALYIAVKLLEPVSMDVQSLADLSRGAFGSSDILEMELDMIAALNWNISHGPTPIGYVQLYLTLLPIQDKEVYYSLWEQAQYQAELSVVNYKLVTQRVPSQVGLAAVFNALEAQLEPHNLARQWQYQLWNTLSSIGLLGDYNCVAEELSHTQLQLCKLQYKAEAHMQERQSSQEQTETNQASSSHSHRHHHPHHHHANNDDDDDLEAAMPSDADYDYSDEETERSSERTPYLFPSPISVAADLLSASSGDSQSKPKEPRQFGGFFSYIKSLFSA